MKYNNTNHLFSVCDCIEVEFNKNVTENPKVSIIVPLYKCSTTVEGTIKSIQSQEFYDFEVIFVDDASPDNSVEVIQPYLNSDERFRLIRHEHNLGLGGARNTGIRYSRAPFMMSADSDDFMKPEMVGTLYEAIEGTDYEFVTCAFARVTPDRELISLQKMKDATYDITSDSDLFGFVNPAFWNKIWRRSSYVDNNTWFPNHLFYQDSVTTPRILANSTAIRTIPDVLYEYVVRPGSITTTVSDKHLLDYFRGFDVLAEFLMFNGRWEEQRANFLNRIDRSITHHLENGAKQSEIFENRSIYIRNLLRMKAGYLSTLPILLDCSDKFVEMQLEKARSLNEIIGHIELKPLPVTVIVKSFLRPEITLRLLNSIVEFQRLKGIAFSEVIVVDDSPKASQLRITALINDFAIQAPELYIRLITIDEIVGTSAGRNVAVDAVNSDYILQCDDDFIFDEDMDLEKAINEIENTDYNVLGGWLKDRYNTETGDFNYRATQGFFVEHENGLVQINCRNDANLDAGILDAEYIAQFFIAETTTLQRTKWDPELRTEEHQEFFYRLKKADARIGLTKSLVVKHTASKKDNPPEYNKHRYGKKTWMKYLMLATKKMNAKNRILQSYDAKGYFRWIVDAELETENQLHIPSNYKLLYQSVEFNEVKQTIESCSNLLALLANASDDPWFLTTDKMIPIMENREVDDFDNDVVSCRQNITRANGDYYAIDPLNLLRGNAQVVTVSESSDDVIINDFSLDQSSYGIHVYSNRLGWRSIKNNAVCSDETRLLFAVVSDIEGVSGSTLNVFKFSDLPPANLFGQETNNVSDAMKDHADMISSWRLSGDLKTNTDDRSNDNQSDLSIGRIIFSPSGDRILLITSSKEGQTVLDVYEVGRSDSVMSVPDVTDAVWRSNNEIIVLSSYHDSTDSLDYSRLRSATLNGNSDLENIAEKLTLSDHITLSNNGAVAVIGANSSKQNFEFNALSAIRLEDGRERIIAVMRESLEWYSNVERAKTRLNAQFVENRLYFNSLHAGFQRCYYIDQSEIEVLLGKDIFQAPVHNMRKQYIAFNQENRNRRKQASVNREGSFKKAPLTPTKKSKPEMKVDETKYPFWITATNMPKDFEKPEHFSFEKGSLKQNWKNISLTAVTDIEVRNKSCTLLHIGSSREMPGLILRYSPKYGLQATVYANFSTGVGKSILNMGKTLKENEKISIRITPEKLEASYGDEVFHQKCVTGDKNFGEDVKMKIGGNLYGSYEDINGSLKQFSLNVS